MINDQFLDKSAKPASISEYTNSLFPCFRTKRKREMPDKCYIIIHNLKESSASGGPARKQDDIKKCTGCTSLLQTYLHTTVTITNAIHLG